MEAENRIAKADQPRQVKSVVIVVIFAVSYFDRVGHRLFECAVTEMLFCNDELG